MCVCERERERQILRETERERELYLSMSHSTDNCICVYIVYILFMIIFLQSDMRPKLLVLLLPSCPTESLFFIQVSDWVGVNNYCNA